MSLAQLSFSRFGSSSVTTRAGQTAKVTINLTKGVGHIVGSVRLPASAQGQARAVVTSSLGEMIEQLGPKGTFRIGSLPEAQYTVEVRCTGCTWPAKPVQVVASQEARVEFQ